MKPMTTGEILMRARNAYKMGEYPLVEKLAMRILDDQPGSAVAYNLLGSVCEKQGRFRKAIEMFQKAVEMKPDYTEAHNNLGVLLKRVEDYGEAIPHFEKAIQLDPRRGDVYYNLGNVHKALGNLPLAEENFEQALAVDPQFVPAANNLGTVLEAQGRFGDAIRAYQKGLQADQNQARLHYNLGVVFERIGRLEEARAEYEAAVHLKPSWADALNNLGVALHRMGDEKAAEKALRDALRTDQKNSKALNNLGVVLAAQGKRDDAILAYRDAIRSNPRYTAAFSNLSRLEEEAGHITEALEELKRLVKLDPEDIDARLRMGGIYLLLENYPEAAACLEAVLARDPGNKAAMNARAQLLTRTGKVDEALAAFQTLDQGGAPDEDFRLDLAFLWKEKGDFKKAENEVLRYISARPDDMRARILLADVYTSQGLAKQAAQTLREIVAYDPDDATAHRRLAEVYRSTGESKKAIETMEGLINILEKSSNPQDLESLTATLEEYEQAISEHEKDFREDRERTIRRLREMALDTGRTEKETADEDQLMVEDVEQVEEDSVPIINVGGMEPILAVEEAPEVLQLTEEQEPVEEETVSIDDERPPNLVNLLQGQELYEENTALQTFQPQPQLGSPAGGGGGFLPPPAPAAAIQPQILPILQPQGESVLANSLKESVAAQQKLVDKLFDEVRDISRKLDQKPQAMPITVSVAPPQASPPPPYMRPVVLQVPQPPLLPPQPQQGRPAPHAYAKELEDHGEEGLPRYAEDVPPDEEQGGGPRMVHAPEAGLDEPGVEDLEPLEEAPVETLEEEPETLEPFAEMPEEAGAGEQTPSQPEPEVTLEEAPEALFGEPAAAPGAQKTRPGTEARTPPQAPAPEEQPAGAPGKEAPSELRKQLRDYISGIKDRLDGGQAPPTPKPASRGAGELLDYLGKLSEYLPERQKSSFLASQERLAMEAVKSRLAGRKGLRQKVQEDGRMAAPRSGGPLTRPRVVDTFTYLKDLSAWHPDKRVGAALRDRIDSILARIGKTG
jgi:tetratricopeptide (TPR) repeat protein